MGLPPGECNIVRWRCTEHLVTAPSDGRGGVLAAPSGRGIGCAAREQCRVGQAARRPASFSRSANALPIAALGVDTSSSR